MKINPNIFVIPDEKNFILYSPLNGSVLEVTPAIIKEMQNLNSGEKYNFDSKVYDVLLKKNFIGKDFPETQKKISNEYKPTSVVLLPTWDCNLKCRYCYSFAGKDPDKLLDIKIAKSAVDLITKNCIEKNLDKISVNYHGGGEPLLGKNMIWIKEITDYSKRKAKENNLKIHVGAGTNGFLSKKNLEWIVNNFDSINVSLDGLEDIQNYQRPNKLGGPSFKSIERAIKFLEEKKFNYGVRSTITDLNVGRMDEFIKYIAETTSLKRIHLESLFECGRCEEDGTLKVPSNEEFIKNFIKAKKIADKNGIKIYNSASELEKVGLRFCGATGTNFFITPDGNVTTCLEVSRPDDDMNDIFIVGNFDKNKNKFIFYEDRLDKLRKRVVENMAGCNDCFAKYNCSGDCIAKAYTFSRDLYSSVNNFRCETNKALLLHEIKEKLKNNKIQEMA